jgi:hypothetical protein
MLVVYHAVGFDYPVHVSYYVLDGTKMNLIKSDQIHALKRSIKLPEPTTASTLFPASEPRLASKLRLTGPELQQIQTILGQKSDLVLRSIGRNHLGLIEAWMGHRSELPTLTHGPVYIFTKVVDSWVQSTDMSEWNEKG